MHVLVVLATRPPSWEPERFLAWWRGPHADAARRLPGLLTYTHGAVVRDFDAGAQTWDGVARLGFAGLPDLDAALASEEWRAAVAQVGEMRGRRIALICDEVELMSAQPQADAAGAAR